MKTKAKIKSRLVVSITEQPDNKPVWFQNGKATDNPNFSHNCSSHLYLRTINKARKITRGILNRWPQSKVRIERVKYTKARSKYDKHTELWSTR